MWMDWSLRLHVSSLKTLLNRSNGNFWELSNKWDIIRYGILSLPGSVTADLQSRFHLPVQKWQVVWKFCCSVQRVENQVVEDAGEISAMDLASYYYYAIYLQSMRWNWCTPSSNLVHLVCLGGPGVNRGDKLPPWRPLTSISPCLVLARVLL